MILDPQARRDIAQQWAAVKKLCAGSHRPFLIPGGPFINETPPESFYNLPFLLAYAVLDQVLAELIDQGTIQCHKKRLMLGDRMVASVNAVPWKDYALVDSGKTARNELAHEARLLAKIDLLQVHRCNRERAECMEHPLNIATPNLWAGYGHHVRRRRGHS